MVFAATLLLLAGVTACVTARQFLALKQVAFHVDRAADIRVAGIAVERIQSFSDINVLDAARLAAAALQRQVPLVFDLHVIGVNPPDNHTTARLVRMTWTLALNGNETVSGTIDTSYTFVPGQPTDMAIPIRLDLYQFFRSNARDAFELAKGLSGTASRPTEISLRAVPTIDTPLGAITYPGSITVVRRTVGGP
jgi:hypothetical protein